MVVNSLCIRILFTIITNYNKTYTFFIDRFDQNVYSLIGSTYLAAAVCINLI